MGRLANLKELWIDNNKIKLLPPTIGGWVKLERLLMHNNQLKMLPKQLPELVMMEVLTLSGNRLTNLPWDLWKLKRLQELWIDCNELERLPEGIETMPSLKSVSCKHNPYFKDEIPRVDRISEMFPDSSGAMKVKEAAEAAAREAERLALTALSTTIVVDYDDPDEQEKSAAQDMQEELELLKKDLAEALENGDYEGADRLQSLIDELAEKLAGGGAGAFGRVPSAAQDSQSLSVQIEVLCCTGLVPSSKKTPILSPYVSSHLSLYPTFHITPSLYPTFLCIPHFSVSHRTFLCVIPRSCSTPCFYPKLETLKIWRTWLTLMVLVMGTTRISFVVLIFL